MLRIFTHKSDSLTGCFVSHATCFLSAVGTYYPATCPKSVITFIRVFIILFLIFYCVSIYLFTFFMIDENNLLFRASRADMYGADNSASSSNAVSASASAEAAAGDGDALEASSHASAAGAGSSASAHAEASSRSAAMGGDDEEAPLVPKKSL